MLVVLFVNYFVSKSVLKVRWYIAKWFLIGCLWLLIVVCVFILKNMFVMDSWLDLNDVFVSKNVIF